MVKLGSRTEAPRPAEQLPNAADGGFLPGRPNKNIFRARRSHPETGIAHYT